MMERRDRYTLDKLGIPGRSDFTSVLSHHKLTLYYDRQDNSYSTIVRMPFNRSSISGLITDCRFPDVPVVSDLALQIWDSVKDPDDFRYPVFSWSNIKEVRTFIESDQFLAKTPAPKKRIYDQFLGRFVLWNLLLHSFKSVVIGSDDSQGIIPDLQRDDQIVFKDPNEASSYDEILAEIESRFIKK